MHVALEKEQVVLVGCPDVGNARRVTPDLRRGEQAWQCVRGTSVEVLREAGLTARKPDNCSQDDEWAAHAHLLSKGAERLSYTPGPAGPQ